MSNWVKTAIGIDKSWKKLLIQADVANKTLDYAVLDRPAKGSKNHGGEE